MNLQYFIVFSFFLTFEVSCITEEQRRDLRIGDDQRRDLLRMRRLKLQRLRERRMREQIANEQRKYMFFDKK